MTYADSGYTNPHAVTSVAGQAYTYDRNGNLASDGLWSHKWDYRNRLITSIKGTTTTSYTYNHENTRTKLTEGATITRYPFENYEIKNSVAKIYLNLGDIFVGTIEGTSTNPTYILTDHLGGTTHTTNASGTIIQILDYYPYGETRIDTGTTKETDQYTGYKKDYSTNLNYAGARYYNGSIGRFISQDPVALALGNQSVIEDKTGIKFNTYLRNPQTHNSYGYAGNNPVKYKDKNGEFLFLVPIAAIAMTALSAYDTYDTARTVMDSDTSFTGKAVAIGLWASPLGDVKASKNLISEFITRVNGRLPINHSYAGQTYKLSGDLGNKYPKGVQFDEQGFPNFSAYSKSSVQISVTGKHNIDFQRANQAAGYSKTPDGYTWHHHQDGKTMQLVPKDLHKEVRHTGGAATKRGKERN
jgi:RHS repeat-associated protein